MTDAEKLLRLFDLALMSDDPAIKTALSSLIMLVTLTHSDGAEIKGPLQRIVEELALLRGKIESIESGLKRIEQVVTNDNAEKLIDGKNRWMRLNSSNQLASRNTRR
jgi:hypothetical protein